MLPLPRCQGVKKNAKRQKQSHSEKWKNDHRLMRKAEGIGENSARWSDGKALLGLETQRCRDVVDLAFQVAGKTGKSVAEIKAGLIIDVSCTLSLRLAGSGTTRWRRQARVLEGHHHDFELVRDTFSTCALSMKKYCSCWESRNTQQLRWSAGKGIRKRQDQQRIAISTVFQARS